MRSLVAAGLWAALSVATQTADAQEPIARLPLDEAVTLALLENPVVRAKEFERQAVAANEITAGLRPNPQVTFLSEQHPAGSASVPQYTFSIGQPIELGGKRQRRVDSARAATQVTVCELADLKRQAVYQVKKSFADILVARDSLALAEENLKTLDELERVQRFRAERGDLSELELLRIQVQRFAFERDALDVRQALSAAKIALRAISGQDRIAEGFELVGELEYRDISYTQADLYRLVMTNRPDIRAAEAAR